MGKIYNTRPVHMEKNVLSWIRTPVQETKGTTQSGWTMGLRRKQEPMCCTRSLAQTGRVTETMETEKGWETGEKKMRCKFAAQGDYMGGDAWGTEHSKEKRKSFERERPRPAWVNGAEKDCFDGNRWKSVNPLPSEPWEDSLVPPVHVRFCSKTWVLQLYQRRKTP